MSKTCTDLRRLALNGPTMGTRWSALTYAPATFDPAPLQAALQAAVDEVDSQMSTWRPDSALMRLNAAPPGAWVPLPARLIEVLACGLEIGRASGGAFDIGMGDAVAAWGFGPAAADPARIRAAVTAQRRPAQDRLELDRVNLRARKHGPLQIDLNGIAKGYGVDRLAEVTRSFGLSAALLAIDGELRALGSQPDGSPWPIAVERPDYDARAALSLLALQDAAVATSGDYRHWVQVGGRRLSHTMDPRRGGPLLAPPASVTVVAPSCMLADAWATALMVLGCEAGATLAAAQGLDALFLIRDGDALRTVPVGQLFGAQAAASTASASATSSTM
ncbi:thiamine biosynthesis lipoprotein [Gemmobacter aquatilis]|uniref:FAD:protein FMN transferase n=1 Tax=Gemmobacter aquatilis TaxID=933059 RepID=A0A1H8FKG2_9RHOB|nr:FAD:protein FMN transferase [Gemmobacter aquatilis]SEN32351.1 thiamine biosynthesis lipoprotein [Gemmobacter aquatilis]